MVDIWRIKQSSSIIVEGGVKINLQKGDKFKNLTGNKFEVIARAYDEYDKVLYYFCKRLDTKLTQIAMVDNASILEIIE